MTATSAANGTMSRRRNTPSTSSDVYRPGRLRPLTVGSNPKVALESYPYHPIRSTMTLVEPKSLRTSILPPAESLTMTRLGTACPATKLRSEATGALVPSGQTTKSLAAVGPSTVTLNTTAFAVPGRAGVGRGDVHHDRAHTAGRDPARTGQLDVESSGRTEVHAGVGVTAARARVGDAGRGHRHELAGRASGRGRVVALQVDHRVGRADPVVDRHQAQAAKTDRDQVGHGLMRRPV